MTSLDSPIRPAAPSPELASSANVRKRRNSERSRSPVVARSCTTNTAPSPAGTSTKSRTARASIALLHAQQVKASPLGRQVIASRSGHLVPLDEPDVIAHAVRSILTVDGRTLGLAIVRREVEPGAEVVAGGRGATVVRLPFGGEELDA